MRLFNKASACRKAESGTAGGPAAKMRLEDEGVLQAEVATEREPGAPWQGSRLKGWRGRRPRKAEATWRRPACARATGRSAAGAASERRPAGR